jgi:methionyl aminopeptidase
VIVCRSQSEIDKLRRVNQLVARILAELRRTVAPGVTTHDIDTLAERRVREAGAEPAFKGYHGYPATVCASVNEQVVHGIPSSRALVEGDILSIDMGAKLDGFYGDCAVTVPVGSISPEAASLLKVTEEALFRGIAAVKPGARVSDIGAAVQKHVEAQGYSVVREFVGHGIGTSLHEDPQVANYGPGGSGPRLSEGMVLAIEPMVNAGKAAVKVLSDGWTAVTVDRSLSAHFEHTVVVTREGTEILTLLTEDVARVRGLAPAELSLPAVDGSESRTEPVAAPVRS